jgi:hypothetical protein
VEIAATHEPDAQESIFGPRCATPHVVVAGSTC